MVRDRCCDLLPLPIPVRSLINIANLAVYFVVCHTAKHRQKTSFIRSCSSTACSTTTAPASMNRNRLWLDSLLLCSIGCRWCGERRCCRRRCGRGWSCLRSLWWCGDDNWHIVVVPLLSIAGVCCFLLSLISTKTGQFQLKFELSNSSPIIVESLSLASHLKKNNKCYWYRLDS